MISLSDVQPLYIAKINIFSSTIGVLQKDISVTKSMPFSEIEEVPVQTKLRDGASFRRLTSLAGLKYLHQPLNLVLNILTLTCNI